MATNSLTATTHSLALPVTFNINFNLKTPIEVKATSLGFISYSEHFDLHSQGNSVDEAIANIGEAIQLLIETQCSRGLI